jgi:hypothetical protein
MLKNLVCMELVLNGKNKNEMKYLKLFENYKKNTELFEEKTLKNFKEYLHDYFTDTNTLIDNNLSIDNIIEDYLIDNGPFNDTLNIGMLKIYDVIVDILSKNAKK